MKHIDITDINSAWDDDAIPVLMQYIEIPARLPMFDPDWESAGHIDAAAELFLAWVQGRELLGLSVELVRLPGLTPVLVAELPATRSELANSTVVLYGHMDKQPEMLPWSEGLGPCAFDSGPSTPTTKNCASGNFRTSMPMNGIVPPTPHEADGLPK